MARLVIVHHSPTRSTRSMLDAVVGGARDPEITGVETTVVEALAATADDVLGADACLLGTSVHFGYMSGALKHFFDTTFMAIGGALDPSGAPAGTNPRPGSATLGWGLWVHGRYDTTGGIRSITSIVSALGWRQAASILDAVGDIDDQVLADAHDLGATMAAGLMD